MSFQTKKSSLGKSANILVNKEEINNKNKIKKDEVRGEKALDEVGKTDSEKIIYATRKAKVEKLKEQIPDKIKELYRESSKYFNNKLAEFVYLRTYSRWIEAEERRETWVETVDRYVNFMRENLGKKLTQDEYEEIRQYILEQKAMPSMRLMQFAGDAARRCNVTAYNCSFIAPTKLEHFGEIMYILMCGTGVGFSVESETVSSLPQIKRQNGEKLETYVVPDTKEGWSDALVYALKCYFNGKMVEFDYSLVRPAGAKLHVSGGRASGPEPLMEVIEFAKNLILSRQGKRLEPIHVHDLICMIAQVVIAGGVRRSATISLSDVDDSAMRDAKKGEYYVRYPYRGMANNSAIYEEKPSVTTFMEEWHALIESNSGERGMFIRHNLESTLPKRRVNKLKNKIHYLGTNPCGEIILQSMQFCNLSEIVARKNDTYEDLAKKMRIATILGTYQSTLTKFNYISKDWKKACEDERLLGVSITGQYDCEVVREPKVLEALKKEARKINKKYAKRFGINSSTSITCVKPSGTLSQVTDTASGMHPRFADYYMRRVRIAATDPLFDVLKDQGVVFHPEVGQTWEDATTWVIDFAIKAPDGAICTDDVSALEQLEYWKMLKIHYTEHNPSCTIYVGPDEWLKVANWIYENWEYVGGLAFLPRSEHVYRLAPYEKITKEEYEKSVVNVEDLDFSLMYLYEKYDTTELKKQLACVGSNCEI